MIHKDEIWKITRIINNKSHFHKNTQRSMYNNAISISFSECHAVELCAILFMSSCDILAYGCSKFNNDVSYSSFVIHSSAQLYLIKVLDE